MRKVGESFDLSATDLVGYLNCRHLSNLDYAVAQGTLEKPEHWDPLLQLLWERGAIHERNYVEHLETSGLEVVRIDGVAVTDDAAVETRAAMEKGVAVIVQAALSNDGWPLFPPAMDHAYHGPRKFDLPPISSPPARCAWCTRQSHRTNRVTMGLSLPRNYRE